MTGKLSYGRRNAEAISADDVATSVAGRVAEANDSRSAVNSGACLTAAAVATGLVGATVARADDDDHYWKRKRHHHSPPYYVAVPPVGYYAPPPVVYAPPPVVYYPAPMAYAPAYPVYGPPPGSLNFGVTLPLR